MIEHTTRAFDADLRELARKIAEMGRLDDAQIADAIAAWVKRDAALAKRVIAADDRVDALQREIEEKAATTIARRQPMAVICGKFWAPCAFLTILSGLATWRKMLPSGCCWRLRYPASTKSWFSSVIWWTLCATSWRGCCKVTNAGTLP